MRAAGRTTAFFLVAMLVFALAHCRKAPRPGDPLAGLTAKQRDQFRNGRVEFDRTFTPETGLGPLFNSVSCGECHESPRAGGSGDEVELHATAFRKESSMCDPLVEKGGPVIQQAATPALRAAVGADREPMPEEATGTGKRTTPDLFGFGLLDAIPDETLAALADPEDQDGDGISGRLNRFVDGRIGRFGRKAFVPTLREFNDGAFVAEQGITNPAVPTEESFAGKAIPEGVDPTPDPEIGLETLDLVDAFVRLLAPAEPRDLTRMAGRGRRIFSKIGCARCHVPVLKTGDSPVKALRHQEVHAYTDLLLHDMGPELADICLGLASPSEFRTEPLMGLSLSKEVEEGEPRFLHDGRARSIKEAIGLHGGEAASSRDRFEALSDRHREALLEFLRSL